MPRLTVGAVTHLCSRSQSAGARHVPGDTNLQLVSIGGVEVDHFSIWHDNTNVLTDGNLTFPDLSNSKDELKQTNKIFPEPCDFISKSLPECSVIRPSSVQNAGAMAAVKALTASNLFKGQSKEFFDTIRDLAQAADEAEREV
jgi:hypothetical protein